jgi:hypothetical protein
MVGSPTWPAAVALMAAVIVSGCLPGDARAARLVLEPASGPAGSMATLRGSGLAGRERVRVRVGKRAVRARTSRRGFLRTAVRIPATAQLPVPVVAT